MADLRIEMGDFEVSQSVEDLENFVRQEVRSIVHSGSNRTLDDHCPHVRSFYLLVQDYEDLFEDDLIKKYIAALRISIRANDAYKEFCDISEDELYDTLYNHQIHSMTDYYAAETALYRSLPANAPAENLEWLDDSDR